LSSSDGFHLDPKLERFARRENGKSLAEIVPHTWSIIGKEGGDPSHDIRQRTVRGLLL
jgi:hypothetical protein